MNSNQEQRMTFKEVMELEKELAPPGSRDRAFFDAVSGHDSLRDQPVLLQNYRRTSLLKAALTFITIAASILVVFVLWPRSITTFCIDRQVMKKDGLADVVISDELNSRVSDLKVIDNRLILNGHFDLTMYRPDNVGDFVYVLSHSNVENKLTEDRWSLEPRATRESIGPYTPRGKQGVFVLIVCKELLPASLVKEIRNFGFDETKDLEKPLTQKLKKSGQERITLKFIVYEKDTGR